MHPIVAKEGGRYNRLSFTTQPTGETSKRGREEAVGGVHVIRIRRACAPCNNGWMSQLEREVRPFIEPLVEGNPIALDHTQMAIVARWIALKCMVVEHNADKILMPRRDRIAFKDEHAIPPYYRIYVGAHDTEHLTAFYRDAFELSINTLQPPVDDATYSLQAITFYLGRVFVHMTASRIPVFQIEQRTPHPTLHKTARIWPLDQFEMAWPREPRYSMEAVNEIAFALGDYVRSKNPLSRFLAMGDGGSHKDNTTSAPVAQLGRPLNPR